MLITLFTPTYNRKHTLHRVYESIRNQTLLKDKDAYLFVWVIVSLYGFRMGEKEHINLFCDILTLSNGMEHA